MEENGTQIMFLLGDGPLQQQMEISNICKSPISRPNLHSACNCKHRLLEIPGFAKIYVKGYHYNHAPEEEAC